MSNLQVSRWMMVSRVSSFVSLAMSKIEDKNCSSSVRVESSVEDEVSDAN